MSKSEDKFLGISSINVSKENLEGLRELMKSSKMTEWNKFDK